MKVLLDSHFAIWLTFDRQQLSSAEFGLLTDLDTQVFVSAVSIWELRIKWEKRFTSGERKGKVAAENVLRGLRRLEVELLDLTVDEGASILTVAARNNDPFDEQLLVCAQERGLRLLTRDTKLQGHPLVLSL